MGTTTSRLQLATRYSRLLKKMNHSLAHTRPIVIIGAGGIVNTAHLPAYKLAGYQVAGIYDVHREKAQNTARNFNIQKVYESLQQAVDHSPEKVIYDVAVPGAEILGILQHLPDHAAVLMQKPMGNDYKEAQQILELTRTKQMTAGVNFQLRYAPYINTVRQLIRQGAIGELCDIEVHVNVFTPWHLWTFLFESPRVEILYHSIHYIDLVRSFLGNPFGMYAKTVRHPNMFQLASVRSNIIMDYGDMVRANILTNHCHQFGLKHQRSYLKFEGTRGAIKVTLGVLINYPQGMPDTIEYVSMKGPEAGEWKTVPVTGTWFPHAFIGSMEQIMLAADKQIAEADNSVEDCIDTMACVEAAYKSSEQGGVSLTDIR
jgi:predicted dehydrogenase